MSFNQIHVRYVANAFISFGLCATFFATSLSHVVWLGLLIWATQPVFWNRAKQLLSHPFAQCCMVWFLWLFFVAIIHPSQYADSIDFAVKHAVRMLIPLGLLCVPLQTRDKEQLLSSMLIGLLIFSLYISCAQIYGWHQSNIVQLSVLAAMFLGLIASRSITHKWHYWQGIAGLFLLVFLLFINKERSGVAVFLALVGVLGLYAGSKYLSLRRLLQAGATVACLLVFFLWLSPVMSARIVKAYHEIWMFADGQVLTAVGARLALYGAVFDIIQHHPFLGLGLGGFEQYFPTTSLGKMFHGAEILASNPHQNFLSILADQGIIGFTIFAGIMLRLLFISSHNRMAWLAVWVSFYFGGLFNSFWIDRQVIIICFVLFALLSQPIIDPAKNESKFAQV